MESNRPIQPPGEAPGKVLVADDDATFRRVFSRLLAREGYDCHEAGDAGAALEQIRSAHPPFDVLIADIHMPGNFNLEMVRELSQSPFALPVILLTGMPNLDTAVDSVQLRVVAYFIKPPDWNEVRRSVQEAVRLTRQVRGLGQVRHALSCWSQDLDRIETVMHTAPEKSSVLAEYLLVLVENLQASIAELTHVAESLNPSQRPSETTDPTDLIEALRETIHVLDKTRSSFRSKTLGELRVKLSRIVTDGRGGLGNKPD